MLQTKYWLVHGTVYESSPLTAFIRFQSDSGSLCEFEKKTDNPSTSRSARSAEVRESGQDFNLSHNTANVSNRELSECVHPYLNLNTAAVFSQHFQYGLPEQVETWSAM